MSAIRGSRFGGGVLAALVDLVLPARCVGCGGRSAVLCPACQPGGPALRVPIPGVPVYAAGEYGGSLRTALLAYKERGRRDLAGPLGLLLAAAVSGLLAERGPPNRPTVLVPVPSARSAAAARGGDHMRRLARRCAVVTGLRWAPDVLHLTREPRDSAGLGVAERAANLGGAFASRAAPAGWTAILVDDIVTTGTTLREARRALLAERWAVPGCAVVAGTPRRAGSDRHPLAAPS